jgi:sortase (surface protein transpeptidase)
MKAWSCFLAVAGLLALGYWAYERANVRMFRAPDAAHFLTEPKAEPRPAEAGVQSEYPSSGSTMAMMEIRRLGLSAVVVEGAKEHALTLAPGHLRGTPLLGGGGDADIGGHKDAVGIVPGHLLSVRLCGRRA